MQVLYISHESRYGFSENTKSVVLVLCYIACHLTYPYLSFNSKPLNFKPSLHKVSGLTNMVSPAICQTNIHILTARGGNIRRARSDFL